MLSEFLQLSGVWDGKVGERFGKEGRFGRFGVVDEFVECLVGKW